MITYDTGGIQFLINIFSVNGSVFPKAMCFSVPSAIISFFFVYLLNPEYFEDPPLAHFQPKEDNIMNNNAVWGGFSFLIGFLVVFRTSQAYSRFWEGCTQMHKMGAEWFDACSSLVAFCKHASVDAERILTFQNTLIRLFSMLHAAALGQIEDTDAQDYAMVVAFNLELIDPESIDDESMEEIRACHAKVELIFQWIQQLIVENIKPGVLSIPPPILSRSFQEIANGMVHFHEAMKIANVPFPFPYAQTCDALLALHWFMVPFVVAQWVTKPWWAAVFSFIQVFTFWCLNLIALELENPFGTDPNDIDGGQMQVEMNERLRLLLRTNTKRTPRLIKHRGDQETLVHRAIAEDEDFVRLSSRPSKLSAKSTSSFAVVWREIDDRKQMAPGVGKAMSIDEEEPLSPEATSETRDERTNGGDMAPLAAVPEAAPAQYHTKVAQDGFAKAASPPGNARQTAEATPEPQLGAFENAGWLAHDDGLALMPYRENELQAKMMSSRDDRPDREYTDGILEDRIGEILEVVNDEVASIYDAGLDPREQQDPHPGDFDPRLRTNPL